MANRLYLFITTLMLILPPAAGAGDASLWALTEAELVSKQSRDQDAVMIYRRGLQEMLSYARSDTDLFPRTKTSDERMLTAAQRGELKHFWGRMLDYYLALNSVDLFHRDFLFLEQRKTQSFYISYSALLAKYSVALQFLELTENDPALDTVFNEPVPELGLEKDTYAKFKFRFLNVLKAGQFAAYETVRHTFKEPRDAPLLEAMQEDRERIWEMGEGTGARLTLKNAASIIKTAGSDTLFPVQKGISNWMGKTKVYRKGKYLISDKQINEIAKMLEPGDILLERREWHLTNVGIPGFWTHAALYIGTAQERSAYFSSSALTELLKAEKVGSVNELIESKYPAAYRHSLMKKAKGRLPRVAEAISEGVTFTAIEFSAKCDSLAVLRPMVSKKAKATAVLRAFKYYGRPYDYNFDFLTDSALVCSELIYKCYESGSAEAGFNLPLERIMGRYMMAPNLLAKEFDRIHGRPGQTFDLVVFLDGIEREQRSQVSDASSFRKSWQRPKWHILIQDYE